MTGDRVDASNRVRYARQAGIFPAAAKKPGVPQIEVVHATSMALALMKGGLQVDVVSRIREAWHMPREGMASGPHGAPGELPPRQTFGQQIATEIERLARQDGFPPDGVEPSPIFLINVVRDAPVAKIRTLSGANYWYRGRFDAAAKRAAEVLIASSTETAPHALVLLAALVRDSRIEASRLGVTIPTADAYLALGLLPPGGPGQPTDCPGIPGDAPSSPETKKADGPGSPTAFAGQPAFPQTCPVRTRQGSEKGGRVQHPTLPDS